MWSGSGIGRRMTEAGWRTTSIWTSGPWGSRTRSDWTVKTFPVKIVVLDGVRSLTAVPPRQTADRASLPVFELPKLVDDRLQVSWKRCAELDTPAVARVREGEPPGVEERAAQRRQYAVVGGEVRLTQRMNGQEHAGESDAEGKVRMDLPKADYEIWISHPDFDTWERREGLFKAGEVIGERIELVGGANAAYPSKLPHRGLPASG